MTGYIGTSGGRKEIKEIFVGTASGRKQVERAWVGTAAGNKVWYERFALTTALTATPASTSQINLSWTASQGCTYQLHRTAGPTTGPLPNGSTALAYADGGLPPNTTCSYRLDVYRNGVLVGSPTASASTQAVPPPQYQQKVATLARDAYGSYSGSGAKRSDTADLFFGQYSGTWGLQKWLATFPVPADLRNCVSVDKVEVSVYNLHAYNNAGASVGLVVHHGSITSTYPGSTGICRTLTAPKPGWWGGSEWIDVTNDVTPGRTTVREEFRALGATGIGFAATTTAQSGYGYSRNDVRLRVHYTVRIA